jgi:hypothetical protein
MEDDPDYPVINIREEEEEEVEEEVEEEPEPEEKIFTNIKSNRDKRLENLRKAREARKKKKEAKTEPVRTHITNEIDYDRLINGVVNKLEDNRSKRKASKASKPVEQVQQVQPVIDSNPYSSLFRF